MEEIERHRFGLIGRNISYSFSKGYFSKKFEKLGLSGHSYENFDLSDIKEFEKLRTKKHIKGLNVTIPYKQSVIPYLDAVDPMAKAIGAVNTIRYSNEGLLGYNTDAIGFKNSLTPLLRSHHKSALLLGTGGASKAVAYVLKELGIAFTHVSRNPAPGQLSYTQLTDNHLEAFQIIINCSPVGTFPKILDKPELPYSHLNENHLLYDLIYNPLETAFLKEGRTRGAITQNGLPMLELQAEAAWSIWNMPT